MAETTITVRVIAKGGKFLGDDIGGAAVTIRDAETKEILAQGVTQGDSGPNGQGGIMCVSLQRSQPLPLNPDDPNKTCNYTATISLAAIKRLEVTAFGPLAARSSANTASLTTCIIPGQQLVDDCALIIELPGLICQLVAPPAHTVIESDSAELEVVANVAMMCGCPISDKKAGAICQGDIQPWLPADFEVSATFDLITSGGRGGSQLFWDGTVAGRFIGTWAPARTPPGPGPDVYKVTVGAVQKSTGNTGVDFSTIIVQPPSQPPPA